MWAMAINISRQQQQLLLAWAQDAGGHECCGLLLGTDDAVERVELTANLAAEPANNFEIDPTALIAAEKQARQGGPNIIGYFHSHPNGLARPSNRDAEMAADDGRIWIIVAGGQMTAWQPTREKDGASVSFERVAIVEG
jgi:desampylase